MSVATPPVLQRWLRIALLLLAAQVLALALQAVLLVHKERDLLVDITVARLGVDADEVRAQVLRDSAIGLRLAESRGLPRLLARQVLDDPQIAAVQVFDLDGSVRFAAGVPPGPVPAATVEAIGRARGEWFDAAALDGAAQLQVGRALIDADDKPAGGVLFTLHARHLAEQIAGAREAMLPRVAWTLGGVALALVPLLWLAAVGAKAWLTLRTRLLAAALLLAAGSSLALTLLTLPGFAGQIEPALESKAERVAAGLAGRVSHALALGIPFDRLVGVESYLQDSMARHPELLLLRLEGDGKAYEVRRAGEVDRTVAAPVTGADGNNLGLLLAGLDPGVAVRELRTVAADMAIVFLVAVVLFNEVLGAILSSGDAKAQAAAGTRHQRLGLARLAVFLLILSEELTRAFLPLHIAGLAGNVGLSPGTAVSLPISAYMASFALLTPFAGQWSARFGAARIFALGALLSAAGFGWALAGGGYGAFIAARCLCAAGYAVGTMAMQQHFLQVGGAGERTRSLALLVGAVQTAAICGAPVGGLLAQQFGSSAVFAAAAAFSLLALAVQKLDRSAGHGPRSATPQRLLPLLRIPPVRWSLLTAAMPIKLVLAGFLFYLVPVALRQEQYSSAAIGRAMMLYFVLVAASNPAASWLSDRYGWQRSLVTGGGLLVAAGGLAGLAATAGWLDGPAALMIGIATLGLGTGLSAAALQALLARHGAAAVVLLRTVERMGAVAGPLLAGSLLGLMAYGGVMAAIGAVMGVATLGFMLAGRQQRRVA